MKLRPSLPTLILALLLCFGQTGLLSACGGCTARHDKNSSSASSTSATSPAPAAPAASAATDAAAPSRTGEVSAVLPDSTAVPVPQAGQEQALPFVTLTENGDPHRPAGTRHTARATLSANAEITAAYLTLLEAMFHNDEAAALQAADILATGRGELALPESHWIEGALWFLQRKSINALPFLQTACNARPESVRLLLLRSEALADHKFAGEAMTALDNYLQRHPGNPEVLLQKGVLFLKDNKPAEALAILSSLQGADRTGFVEYYQARALVALGQEKEALGCVRKAVRQLPDFEEALALQAFLCERTDELAEARTAYERLLKTAYDPKDILLRLINISLRMKQPGKALDYYGQGPLNDTSYALLAATLFTEARHYLQAERILKGVVERPDAPVEVYLFLADLTYEQRHDLAAALAWLKNIPDTGEQGQRKMQLLAQLQVRDKRTEEALATAIRARSLFPEVADFVTLQARILATMDKRAEGIALVREGIAKWPDDMDLAFLLGTLLAENGQEDEALLVMEDIVARDNNNALALNFVGYTLANANRDLDRALTLLNRANALSPNCFFILDSLAWAHYRAGNLDMAWKYILDAIRLDTSNDPEIWEHYGDIARSRGLTDEAAKGYRKALDKNPSQSLQHKLDALPR